MSSLSFVARGHLNITAQHHSTFEITKDVHVTKRGDCIIACAADIDMHEVAAFAKNHSMFIVEVKTPHAQEYIIVQSNPHFHDDKEMVFRRTDFMSERTLGVQASKSARMFSEEIRKDLQQDVLVHIQFIPV